MKITYTPVQPDLSPDRGGDGAGRALDLHPSTRLVSYAHIVHLKNTPQASVDGTVSILQRGISFADCPTIWGWVIRGDLNRMIAYAGEPLSENRINQIDSQRLDHAVTNCSLGKVMLIGWGTPELRDSIEERTGNEIKCRDRNVFTRLTKHNLIIAYRGDETSAEFARLKDAVNIANSERQGFGGTPIRLIAFTSADSLDQAIRSEQQRDYPDPQVDPGNP